MLNSDGSVRYGFFDQPVGPIRAADCQLRLPMGGIADEVQRTEAFRSFQFMGAVADNTAIGCAVTKTSETMSAFAYSWSDNSFTELRLANRTGDTALFADDPDHGITELSTARGSVRMEADGHSKQLLVNSDTLNIKLDFSESDFDTLRLCTPTGPTGWAYVQKLAAVEATGTFGTNSDTTDLSSLNALAHHDYTTGFLRPETWWHWACIAGRLPDGRSFGLNVSCGTNESGYRENCFWLDGKWYPLQGALFEFDHGNPESDWRIYGSTAEFDLTFSAGHGYHATGSNKKMSTNFHQMFGRFDGWILVDSEKVDLVAQPGFTESQYLLW